MAANNITNKMYTVSLIVFFVLSVSFGLDLTDKCGDKISGCYCTDMYVDCNGAEMVDLREIYPYITNLTYRINMVNGNIRSIPDNAFSNNNMAGPLSEVKYLNLSGNGIVTIYNDAFKLLPKLETLDLSNNDVFIDSCDSFSDLANSLDSLTEIKYLRLHNFISKEMTGLCGPGFMFTSVNMSHLTSLDVSSNGFDVIDDDMVKFLCGTFTITLLNVSNNLFDQFSVPQCMANLKVLDFSNNQLSSLNYVDLNVIEGLVNLESVRFGGNPFDCDCYLYDLINWLNETEEPLDTDHMACVTSSNSSLIGKQLKGLDYNSYCEPKIAICYGPGGRVIRVAPATFVAIILAGVVTIVVLVSTVCLIYRRRRNKKTQLTTAKAGSGSHMTADVSKSTLYSRMV